METRWRLQQSWSPEVALRTGEQQRNVLLIRSLLLIARVDSAFTDQQRVCVALCSGIPSLREGPEFFLRQFNMALGVASPGKHESLGVHGWRTAAAPLGRMLWRMAVSDYTLTEGFIFTACRYLSNSAIENLGIVGREQVF